MRKKRFSRINKNKNKELEVDITSLLDILVILLVFLLKSYNPTDLKLDVVKDITLPNSESEALGHTATTVQISSDHDFWIDSKKLGSLDLASKGTYANLFEELSKIKEDLKLKEKERAPASKAKSSLNKINLVFEQSLPYSVIQMVLHTSATAGFTEYKFIVQGKYQ